MRLCTVIFLLLIGLVSSRLVSAKLLKDARSHRISLETVCIPDWSTLCILEVVLV